MNLRRLTQNIVFKGTLIISIGLFLTSFLSYLLQIFLGRLLTVSEYGEFVALLSLSVLFTIPSNALVTSITKITSALKAEENYTRITSFFAELTVVMLAVGFLVFLVVVALSTQITKYLNLTSPGPVIPFGLLVMLNLVLLVPTAVLQGLLRFKAFAALNISAALLKLVFAVGFVYLSFGVSGSFYGLCVAFALSYLIGFYFLRSNFTKYTFLIEPSVYKELVKLSSISGVAIASLLVLNNADIIFAKHFLSASDAGIYSSLVTVGKVFLYGAGIVTSVMFPVVTELYTKKGDYFQKFKEFGFLQLLGVVGGVVVFSLFPNQLITIMFGEKFLLASNFLPLYSVFMGVYLLITYLVMFLIAVNKTKLVSVVVVGAVMQSVLLNVYHSSITEILHINIFTVVVILSALITYLPYARFSNRAGI